MSGRLRRTHSAAPPSGIWFSILAIFLAFFDVLRRVAVKLPRNTGKILLTTVSAGRQHGTARITGGPEGDRAARVTVPEPPPRAGHRRDVRFRGLLRRPRRPAGPIRDGSPRPRG